MNIQRKNSAHHFRMQHTLVHVSVGNRNGQRLCRIASIISLLFFFFFFFFGWGGGGGGAVFNFGEGV